QDTAGQPRPYVVHPFILPADISGKAIIWVDLPWAERDPSCEEQGEGRRIGGARYRNRKEVDALESLLKQQLRADEQFLARLRTGDPDAKPLSLAVLAPYTQQVRYIRRRLRDLRLPEGLELKEPLRRRRVPDLREEDARPLAHT